MSLLIRLSLAQGANGDACIDSAPDPRARFKSDRSAWMDLHVRNADAKRRRLRLASVSIPSAGFRSAPLSIGGGVAADVGLRVACSIGATVGALGQVNGIDAV